MINLPKIKKDKKDTKIVVAMSGGVDFLYGFVCLRARISGDWHYLAL